MLKKLAVATAAIVLTVYSAFLAFASQSSLVMPTTGPHTMADMMGRLNPALLSLGSCNSGTSAPANGTGAAAFAGECWFNTTANPWILNFTDNGTNWGQLGAFDTTAHKFKTPTVQLFTSGTNATYTTPAGVVWIEIEEVGAGGGGAASGTTPGAATAGTATCWNTSGTACTSPVYQAGGGGLGSSGAPGTGGTAGAISGSGSCNDSQVGQVGQSASSGNGNPGGAGGSSRYAGHGVGGNLGNSSGGPFAGQAAVANTGSGGGGASVAATPNAGSGGGAGAWCYAIISAPAATYTYTVGAGGSGGTLGTSGAAGGNGAAGKLRVIEHYAP